MISVSTISANVRSQFDNFELLQANDIILMALILLSDLNFNFHLQA